MHNFKNKFKAEELYLDTTLKDFLMSKCHIIDNDQTTPLKTDNSAQFLKSIVLQRLFEIHNLTTNTGLYNFCMRIIIPYMDKFLPSLIPCRDQLPNFDQSIQNIDIPTTGKLWNYSLSKLLTKEDNSDSLKKFLKDEYGKLMMWNYEKPWSHKRLYYDVKDIERLRAKTIHNILTEHCKFNDEHPVYILLRPKLLHKLTALLSPPPP